MVLFTEKWQVNQSALPYGIYGVRLHQCYATGWHTIDLVLASSHIYFYGRHKWFIGWSSSQQPGTHHFCMFESRC